MARYLYDEALTAKFKNWTEASQVQIYGPNEAKRLFEVIGDTTGDESVKLPLIVISGDRGFNLRDAAQTKRPLSYDGLTLNSDGTKSQVTNAIPVRLDYQVDVIAKFEKEADILVRNLIFNIVNYPGFEITIPGAQIWDEKTQKYIPFIHTGVITLSSPNILDNSNTAERFIEGNFTRLSIAISIEDAWLFDTRELHNVDIDVRIDDFYET